MIVLGIETSCDETGIGIYDSGNHLVFHKLHSQVLTHSKFGGVVPELASRDHIRHILPLVNDLLKENNLELKDIGAVAYTAGPGLVGALMVGAAFGRSLAFALDIPSIAVHHLEAHLLAPFLEQDSPSFPFVALLVSGGNTQLIEATSFGRYKLLGETLDDAIGEAFDKVAKILGLEYPGGPALEELAKKNKSNTFRFPRPMINHNNLNFSFSGLKTYALNCFQKNVNNDFTKANIAYAFQEAAIEVLVKKCKKAIQKTKLKSLVVSGGVSANSALRNYLNEMAMDLNIKAYYPRLEFCTDNGAMIAYTGYKYLINKKSNLKTDLSINVNPRWQLFASI